MITRDDLAKLYKTHIDSSEEECNIKCKGGHQVYTGTRNSKKEREVEDKPDDQVCAREVAWRKYIKARDDFAKQNALANGTDKFKDSNEFYLNSIKKKPYYAREEDN